MTSDRSIRTLLLDLQTRGSAYERKRLADRLFEQRHSLKSFGSPVPTVLPLLANMGSATPFKAADAAREIARTLHADDKARGNVGVAVSSKSVDEAPENGDFRAFIQIQDLDESPLMGTIQAFRIGTVQGGGERATLSTLHLSMRMQALVAKLIPLMLRHKDIPTVELVVTTGTDELVDKLVYDLEDCRITGVEQFQGQAVLDVTLQFEKITITFKEAGRKAPVRASWQAEATS